MNRRDLWLYEVNGGWKVAMRQGQGKPTERVFASQQDAAAMFTSIERDAGGEWKDITAVHELQHRSR
jgi:hypothetical protein